MKIRTLLAIGTAVLGFSAAPGAIAQDIGCNDIVFTGGVAQRFPRANEFCLEVRERDGKQYAHFVAEYQRTKGGQVIARIKHPSGGFSDDIAFSPPSDQRVKIDNRRYRYRDLSRGQEINIWVPQDRWELAVHENADEFLAASTVGVMAIEEEETMAAALPSTASPFPLIGLLGAVFMMFGAGIGWIRRRLAS